jgi:hypothetical protein
MPGFRVRDFMQSRLALLVLAITVRLFFFFFFAPGRSFRFARNDTLQRP